MEISYENLETPLQNYLDALAGFARAAGRRAALIQTVDDRHRAARARARVYSAQLWRQMSGFRDALKTSHRDGVRRPAGCHFRLQRLGGAASPRGRTH